MYACKEAMGYTDANRRAGWLGGVWKGKKEKGDLLFYISCFLDSGCNYWAYQIILCKCLKKVP